MIFVPWLLLSRQSIELSFYFWELWFWSLEGR